MTDSQSDKPLLEGGQGRSGTDLENEAKVLTWLAVAIIVGFVVVGCFA